MRHIFIKAYRINMRFTHFQVTFQQAGIQYIRIYTSRELEGSKSKCSSPRHVHSNMASGSDCAVTIPTWRRVGCSRSARLITTNYEQCLHLSE